MNQHHPGRMTGRFGARHVGPKPYIDMDTCPQVANAICVSSATASSCPTIPASKYPTGPCVRTAIDPCTCTAGKPMASVSAAPITPAAGSFAWSYPNEVSPVQIWWANSKRKDFFQDPLSSHTVLPAEQTFKNPFWIRKAPLLPGS